MSADEILAALDEAITKVQVNVQTFENSCSEVGGQAALLQGAYQEKTNNLTDLLMSFEPAVESLKDEIISSLIARAEDVDESVSTTIEEAEGDLDELLGNQLDSLTQSYESTHDNITRYIEDTATKAEGIANDFKATGQTYTEALESTVDRLAAIEGQVQTQLNSFIETVSDNLQPMHSDTLGQLNDFVDNSINSELAGFFMDKDGEFTDFSGNLTNNLENIGESLSNKFSELSIELIDYTDDKATEEVKEIVNGMIDSIVGELASVVSESIVKSTVGVSITTTTSPMLPALIGFNKIFDALEGAIGAWKAFKESFGF